MDGVLVPVEVTGAVEVVGGDDDSFAPRLEAIRLSFSRYDLSP
jgi:hypothetical protein